MSQKVFFNGQICEADDVKIPFSDSGFMYGAGVFETMRSVNGVVFAVKDHLDRLFTTLENLKFNHDLTSDKIKEYIYQLLDANNLTDSRIRLTVTNGPLVLRDKPEPTVLISAVKFIPYPEDYYANGIKTIITNNRINPYSPLAQFKTTSYLEKLTAMNEARSKGATEAIWFTTENKLAQSAMGNLFIVKNSSIITPPLETPVLSGVARKYVLKTALEKGLDIKEEALFIKDLLEADEVFLTNIIMEVMPVNSIERHTVGNGRCGDLTKEILAYFREHLKKECAKR